MVLNTSFNLRFWTIMRSSRRTKLGYSRYTTSIMKAHSRASDLHWLCITKVLAVGKQLCCQQDVIISSQGCTATRPYLTPHKFSYDDPWRDIWQQQLGKSFQFIVDTEIVNDRAILAVPSLLAVDTVYLLDCIWITDTCYLTWLL